MNPEWEEAVATRKLAYALKGDPVRHGLAIRVHKPVEVQPGYSGFECSAGTACCRVAFDGLDEPDYVAHGADTLQALVLAVDIDPILRGLSKKYDFYFEDGNEYFEGS